MKSVDISLGKEIAVKIGIPSFADDIEEQEVRVIRIDCKTSAGGDEEMFKLLERFGS